MNIYLTLFIEFFKTGLFAVGGGLATIPFLYDMAERYDWITNEMISDMIAVAESTPGPIGINVATYVGYNAAGIGGALVATLSLALPSLIIIILIAKFLGNVQDNPYVITVFSGLRPVVTALIAAAGIEIMKTAFLTTGAFAPDMMSAAGIWSVVKVKSLILFAVLFAVSLKKQFHPIVYIGVAAAAGIIFKM